MPTYLLTVKEIESDTQGLLLSPGIRLSQTKDRPSIGGMIQGASLELRRPDGTIGSTVLVTYGLSAWQGDDGALYISDPSDAEIRLTLPVELSLDEIPIGTEVWLVD